LLPGDGWFEFREENVAINIGFLKPHMKEKERERREMAK
jgi:hypothetical protein